MGNRLAETNERGNRTTFDYDSLNRLTTSTSSEGVSPVTTYNIAGWVVSVTDDLNHVTSMGYDKLGRQTSVTDANLHTTTFEYDGVGNQTAMIDAEGIRTTYGYDTLNRLVSVIENDVPGENPTHQQDVKTQYTYDALGNRKTTINARGYTTVEYFYDGLNRPTTERDALENDAVTTYNRIGSKLSLTDRNGDKTGYVYDGVNRLISTNYLTDGDFVSYKYYANGQREWMLDAQGKTTYLYDGLYRLTDVTDAFDQTVSYGYDLAGNRTSLTYPDDRSVTYVYDKDNRMTDVIDWNTGTTSYKYDAAGRMYETTLPNGVVSVNTFDDANRLTDITHTSAEGILLAHYHYEMDKLGNRTDVTEKLHAAGSFAGVGSYLEENGLVVMEAENGTPVAGMPHNWESGTADGVHYMQAGPDLGATDDVSDGAGDGPFIAFPNVAVSNPDVYTVWVRGFAPDAGGDSVRVEHTLPPLEALGRHQITGFLPGEWSWSKLSTFNADAAIDLSANDAVNLSLRMREDGFHVDKVLLTADPNFVPTGAGPAESSMGHPLDEQTITYVYDDLYRLVSADYAGLNTASYSYTYDAAGNMTDFSETVAGNTTSATRTFNDANQLTGSTGTDGTWSFTYDDNGNMVSRLPVGDLSGATTYVFNQRNLLTKVTINDNDITHKETLYTYDGDGNRVQQTYQERDVATQTLNAPAVVTTYTNDNAGMSQMLVSDDGTNVAYTLFGLDLIYQDDGSDVRYMLADGLGSVRQELVGTEIAYVVTNDPFGGMLAMQGASGTTYGFTGEQEDSGSGLVYLRARYYDPYLNQFQSRDPFPGYARLPQSQNGFSYVENNPINYTDPTGKWAWGSGEAILREENDQATELITGAVHQLIQAKVGVTGSNQWHAEYPIPGTPFQRIDLLNSNYGFLYEIKPRYKEAEALAQVISYRNSMNAARGSLHGPAPNGGTYNWDYSPRRWQLGPIGLFSTKEFLGTDPSGWINIYYGQTQPGVIVWWTEQRQTQEVLNPVRVPSSVAWGEKNRYPSLNPAPIPAPIPHPGPQGTPMPPNRPELPPLPQPTPQPVPTPPIQYYNRPGSVCLADDNSFGRSVLVAGGGTYIIYRFIRLVTSPVCGPAAPACAFGP